MYDTRLWRYVPDDLIHELQAIGFSFRLNRFRIGDIACQLRAAVRQANSEGTQDRLLSVMDVYEMVSDLSNREVSARTVRFYADLAEKFTPDVRRRYLELPHSHFALAVQYGDQAEAVLELSEQQRQQTGRAPSEAWLVTQMARLLLDEPVPPSSVDGDEVYGDGHYIYASRYRQWQDLACDLRQMASDLLPENRYQAFCKVLAWLDRQLAAIAEPVKVA